MTSETNSGSLSWYRQVWGNNFNKSRLLKFRRKVETYSKPTEAFRRNRVLAQLRVGSCAQLRDYIGGRQGDGKCRYCNLELESPGHLLCDCDGFRPKMEKLAGNVNFPQGLIDSPLAAVRLVCGSLGIKKTWGAPSLGAAMAIGRKVE